jgi:hypothetical protein
MLALDYPIGSSRSGSLKLEVERDGLNSLVWSGSPMPAISEDTRRARSKLGYNMRQWLLRHSTDRMFVALEHRMAHGRLPDLHGQHLFNERIAWRKLHPQPSFGVLSDKFLVRRLVADRLGEEYLVPLFAHARRMEEVDFGALPSRFVMKASHGYSWTELVYDRASADLDDLRRKGDEWLRRNFYVAARERHYRGIEARILFEQFLMEDGKPARDFKIHCFRRNGHLTQVVEVHSNRFERHAINFFHPDWRPANIAFGSAKNPNPPRMPKGAIPRPGNLDDLLTAADKLSRAFNYVRVDLYSVEGRVYFGEMTFTPGAGLLRFKPPEIERYWASLFDDDRIFYAPRRLG